MLVMKALCGGDQRQYIERISTETRAYHRPIGGGQATDRAAESPQLLGKKVVQLR